MLAPAQPLQRVLVTGAAGFIGSHLVDALLARGCEVTGYDNFDAYYSPETKRLHLTSALAHPRFRLVADDLRDRAALDRTLAEHGPFDAVAHLAARAGVRASLRHPELFFDVNVRGTQILLEALRAGSPQARFVLASSSSVYGADPGPFHEDQPIGRPHSPYAASKHAAELVSYLAHHLHGTDVTVLRFFTAYGPRQRPDMAIPRFTEQILRNEAVQIFGGGDSFRDYTYVGDVVQGVVRALERAHGFRVFNLGSGQLTRLDALVAQLGKALQRPVRLATLPMQPGDVPLTWANRARATAELSWEPSTGLAEGLKHYVASLPLTEAGAAS
jgi:UDP-glucuronate 4-epimerase